MKRVRYSVAMSLDGYIAGPNGESDWILMDPDIDFGSMMNRFDTVLMGRRTFEATAGYGEGGMPGVKSYVVSKTLRQEDHPKTTILNGDLREAMRELQAEDGKEIWLFGGGSLFRSLLDEGAVDTVEVAVIPVLLGEGVPLLEPACDGAKLRLVGSRVYDKTGTVTLEYEVVKNA